jgi:drug/metabolite transporter (DMT)-like permease
VRFNDLEQRVDQPHHLWPPQPLVVAAWFHWVVAGSLIAFSAYPLRLARASTALAASYCLVTPVIVRLLGVAFAGEVITTFEWAAARVVLVGAVLALRGRRD